MKLTASFRLISLGVLIPLIVIGCDKKEITALIEKTDSKTVTQKSAELEKGCSSPVNAVTIKNILSDQAIAAIKEHNSDTTNVPLEISKARSALASIEYRLADIRTTSNDPQSTKKFCAGTLELVLPLDMLKRANQFSAQKNLPTLTKFAEANDSELSADVMKTDIRFHTQPTDDGSKLFTGIEDTHSIEIFLATAVLYSELSRSPGTELPKIQATAPAAAPQASAPNSSADALSAAVTTAEPTQAAIPAIDMSAVKRGVYARVPPTGELNLRGGPNVSTELVVQLMRGSRIQFLGDVALRNEDSGKQTPWAQVAVVGGQFCRSFDISPQGCTNWREWNPSEKITGWVNINKIQLE